MASMDVIVYPGPVDRSRISLYLTTPGSKFWASKISLSLSAAVSRAAALGYDAIEVMPRALDDPEPEHLRALTKRHGLAIAVLAAGFIAVERGLTFTHPDPAVRREAMEAFLGCLEMAQRAGAPLVSIGVIRGKLRRELGHAQAMTHLLACVGEVGRAARERGLTLVLEPGNRYETDFIHTVEEAMAFLDMVNLPNVRLMIDTFHMNIEEPSIPDAIRRGGSYLEHVHVADSNRRAPGWGHLNFDAVAKALRAIGYRGGIGLEMAFEPDFDAAARQGIECVRRLFE